MEAKVKEKWMAMLDEVDSEEPTVRAFKRFLEKYDGTDDTSLELLCLGIFSLLLKVEELKVLAQGYERMRAVNNQVVADSEVLRKEYKDVAEKEYPPQPPVISFASGINEDED